MTVISFALITRAPRMGARLGVRVDGCLIWVSTVFYAGKRFTRVEADECEPAFYHGEIDQQEAAERYLSGDSEGLAA